MRPPTHDVSTARIGQIDALRFLAILMVMLHHYMPQVHLPFFGMGVVLFLVLSGFFGTRQLIQASRRMSTDDSTLRAELARYHGRRYLRILPIYFLVVAFGIAADLPNAREAAGWHFTFTSNWWVLQHEAWMGPFSPFWSLALIEQFHLFWPTLFLSLPRRAIIACCLALMVAGLAWRVHCFQTGLSSFHWLVHPAAGFDQLAAGSLLAIAHEKGRETLRSALRSLGLWVAAPATVVLLFVVERPSAGDVHAIYRTLIVAIFLLWFVDAAARGIPGLLGQILDHPWARAGGRVSYSIFAFHEFTAYLLPPLLRPELPEVLEITWRPLVLVVATCSLATLTFLTVERPFARLKNAWRA